MTRATPLYQSTTSIVRAAIILLFVVTNNAHADNGKNRYNNFENLRSTDTSLIDVKVGDFLYKIPRNYISNNSFDIPIISVTYQNFLPYEDDTKNCFDKPRENNCIIIELILGYPVSNKKFAENLLRNLSKLPFSTENIDKFSVYSLGPGDAKSTWYIDRENGIFFDCHGNEEEKNMICTDRVTVSGGNSVSFFFPKKEIENIYVIEINIKDLFMTFTNGGTSWQSQR